MYMHAIRNRKGQWDLYRDGMLVMENCAEQDALKLMDADRCPAWWQTVKVR